MLFDSTSTWNHQEWGVDEVISQLINKGSIKKCMVVGIWNSDTARHSEYFPQKPFKSLPKSYSDSLLNLASGNGNGKLFSAPVRSDDYLKFIVLELKPYIDKNFGVNPSMETTYIAGSSMGGLISFYALCEYPEVFSGAACLSTHWIGVFSTENDLVPETFVNYLAQNLPEPASHKIYFDHGTETLDKLYEPYQTKVDSVMMVKGYDSSNWKTMIFQGADHTENAWRARLQIPVRFLFSKRIVE
ncbi:MAG: esterase family protein [Bacteroidales bacterium]|nr:esterase family protein [Bacteroidales bacterium]